MQCDTLYIYEKQATSLWTSLPTVSVNYRKFYYV